MVKSSFRWENQKTFEADQVVQSCVLSSKATSNSYDNPLNFCGHPNYLLCFCMH